MLLAQGQHGQHGQITNEFFAAWMPGGDSPQME